MLENGTDSVGFDPFAGPYRYPGLSGWPGPVSSWWPNTSQVLWAMKRTAETLAAPGWRTRGVRN